MKVQNDIANVQGKSLAFRQDVAKRYAKRVVVSKDNRETDITKMVLEFRPDKKKEKVEVRWVLVIYAVSVAILLFLAIEQGKALNEWYFFAFLVFLGFFFAVILNRDDDEKEFLRIDENGIETNEWIVRWCYVEKCYFEYRRKKRGGKYKDHWLIVEICGTKTTKLEYLCNRLRIDTRQAGMFMNEAAGRIVYDIEKDIDDRVMGGVCLFGWIAFIVGWIGTLILTRKVWVSIVVAVVVSVSVMGAVIKWRNEREWNMVWEERKGRAK